MTTRKPTNPKQRQLPTAAPTAASKRNPPAGKRQTVSGSKKSTRPAVKVQKSNKRKSNPLMIGAIWASSFVAAVVVGLLIVNSAGFKSLRNDVNGIEDVASTVTNAGSDTPITSDTSLEALSANLSTTDNNSGTPREQAGTPNSDLASVAASLERDQPKTGSPDARLDSAKPPAKPAAPNPSDSAAGANSQSVSTFAQHETAIPATFGQASDTSDATTFGTASIKPTGISRQPDQHAASSESQPTSTANQTAKPAKRLPVPDKDAQKVKLDEIKSLFKAGYADRSPAGKSALAKELLTIAKDTKEPAAKYVCLEQSLDLASGCGDVETAFAAVDLLSETFEVDDLELRLDTTSDLARKLGDPMAIGALIDRSRPLLEDLVANNQYDTARTAAKKLIGIARKGADDQLESLAKLMDQLKEMERGFEDIKPALEKLKSDPHDAIANQAVGEFYCFVKGDFEKGVAYLAKGSNESMRKTAVMDITAPESTQERLALADSWWELGDNLESVDPSQVRMHAAIYYLEVVTDVTGISKKRIESRLAELKGKNDTNIRLLAESLIARPLVCTFGTQRPYILTFNSDGTCVGAVGHTKSQGRWTLYPPGGLEVLRVEMSGSTNEFYPHQNGFAVERTILSNGSKIKGTAVFE